ncbi:hypothetical protein PH7735_01585 [Shimia thalassica]|uniref:Uncharacterized protein n=1 Tax=Shimia thalassica TaxID=1715693 RepID=A0A0P1I6E2_9RHOB|nr:hypothetical protein PH7735_01585 [Shimia thalassica]
MSGFFEVGNYNGFGIFVCVCAGLAECLGSPQAQQFVGACIGFEVHFFIVSKLGFECVFAIVKGGHLRNPLQMLALNPVCTGDRIAARGLGTLATMPPMD